MNRKSKTEKLLNALSSGKNMTTAQLERRSGLVNVASTINRLRNEGVQIYTNRRGPKGARYRAYRLSV